MRPVIKWRYGTNGVIQIYNPHSNAKAKLLENFGNEPYFYCNYCDRYIPMVNIEVEHLQPIIHYPALEYSWTNFLASCKNCNLAKGEYNLNYATVVLPHIHNTYNLFIFNNDGTISANSIYHALVPRINETISMLGFDRGENHIDRQPQDDRYNIRRHTLFIAKRALTHYENGVNNYIEDILNQAVSMGFWSIWMKVFENHPIVQDALIMAFNSTFSDCRTSNVDRNPIP